MLGLYNQNKASSPYTEVFLNFIVLVISQLVIRLAELFPKQPTSLDFYYCCLFALVVSFSFYGLNKVKSL